MPLNTAIKTDILPAMALRGLVVFPKTVLSFDVGRKKSAKALQVAMESGQQIFLVTQKDIATENVTENDLYTVGCVARVRQVLKIADDNFKVLVEGLYRAKRLSYVDKGSYFICAVEECPDTAIKNREIYIETLIRKVRTEFEKYITVTQSVPKDVIFNVSTNNDLGYLSDYIAFNTPAPFDDKQYVLEQFSPVKRAKILIEMLSKEREISEIDNRISQKTRAAIDETQKEYYLREQMRIISSELYGDDTADEIDKYYESISGLDAEQSVKEILFAEINKLSKMPQGSHEGTVIRDYVDICLGLPWNKVDNSVVDVKKAAKILDRDFYGMQKVKERILEMLSVYAFAPNIKGQIICLVGPPGVGKTSIGKTIAECMGRKFARISLGGVHDEAEIRGHRKTYIGAMPGKILNAISKAGVSNPLILLDEVDKLGNDYKGDPSSALLEVLDPEQNNTFVDHFVDIPYDLSQAVFITTANDANSIPAPLYDRMEIIELNSYTRDEKLNIAREHLVKKQLNNHGLTAKQLKITDDALLGIIDGYTREAGVRTLDRTIASVCRKIVKQIAGGDIEKATIKTKDLEKLLGHAKYHPDNLLKKDTVGVVNGLAWTSVGGEIMQLEVAALNGTGKVELTGSLGDVMKESAHAAISFVRSATENYGIDSEFYKNKDIHIHATEAAVPKDGPSAGVTITVGLVSALTNKPVRQDIAMTGEVTILGRVLPIGGLKEKSMAAYRNGVKCVFIPYENIPDLEDVDKVVKENVQFVPVSHVSEILDRALVENKNSKPVLNIKEPAVTQNTISQ